MYLLGELLQKSVFEFVAHMRPSCGFILETRQIGQQRTTGVGVDLDKVWSLFGQMKVIPHHYRIVPGIETRRLGHQRHHRLSVSGHSAETVEGSHGPDHGAQIAARKMDGQIADGFSV
jgi:hypothetical protein